MKQANNALVTLVALPVQAPGGLPPTPAARTQAVPQFPTVLGRPRLVVE